MGGALAQGTHRAALDASRANPFLDALVPLRDLVAHAGAINALAQQLLKLTAPGGTGSFITLILPAAGTLISDSEPAKLYNKTLEKPALSGLVNAASDAAAASAGVPVLGVYHNAGVLRIRLV